MTRSKSTLRVLAVFALIAILGMLATVPLSWKQQGTLGALLFGTALVVSRRGPGERAKLILVLISVFCTTRYANYRITETYGYLSVNWAQTQLLDLFFVFLLLGAEAYTVVIMFLGYFQCIHPLRRRPAPLPEDPNLWPSVDVFIPTYNESLEVIKSTVFAARNIDWPRDRLRVYILDDGKRAQVHTLASAIGVGYISRLDNQHAKAGNINNALRQTEGEYVAVFDADHIATRSFLQVTMGWFLKDPRLALMQTPHHFYSADPFERNLNTFRKVPAEGELFYGIVQTGNDFWNASFFCGSCAVMRRSALDEIGGIAVETVTEDSHTAVRLQRRGWNSAYIGIPQAGGLATTSIADHVQQRIRWARGMIQVLRREQPLFARGLKWPQRLCYFNAVIHFLYATPRLVFLSAPLVFLLLGRSNLYGYVWTIMAYVLPHMFMAILTNSRIQGGHRHSFWNEVYETVLAPFILFPTLAALVNPRWGRFNVTPKKTVVDRSSFSLRIAAPSVLLLCLNLLGIGLTLSRFQALTDHAGTLLVNLMWATMNTLVLGAAVAAAWDKRQRRAHPRIEVRLPLRLVQPNGIVLDGVTDNISIGGASGQLNLPCELRDGEQAHAVLPGVEQDHLVPVTIVHNRGLRLRFRFCPANLQQEEALTQIVFGRADSWLHWTEGRDHDRPLHSLGKLVLIALKGIVSVPKGLVQPVLSPAYATGSAVRPGLISAALLLFTLLLLAVALRAQPAANPGSAPPPALTFSNTLDLQTLAQKNGLVLRGTESRATLYFAIPITKVVDRATLQLRFQVSRGFQPEASRLNLLLNGTNVGVAQLKQAGISEQTLELPSDLLVTDNSLTFQVSGRCGPNCTDAIRAGLSVQIDPSTQIRLGGTLLRLANDLQLLPAPFFDRSMQRGVNLSFLFSHQPDSEMLQAAGVVASWFGILADDRGVRYSVSVGNRFPGGNAVLVAAGSALAAVLPDAGPIEGPTAFIRDNPEDPFGKVLVVAGRTGAEALRASQALVTGALAGRHDQAGLPSILHVPASFRLPPASAPFDAPRWVDPKQRVFLGKNQSPEQLHIYGSGTINLYFRLPPDLFFGPRSAVPLRLNFRTTPLADRGRSEIRIRLNNVWVTAKRIPADSATGVHHENIQLPVAALYPNNALSIEFVFDPKQEVPEGAEYQYPEATVLTTSELELRGIPRFVRLPKLDLFATAGFPFTRLADLSQAAVVLPKTPEPAEIAVFLNQVAAFGAQTGYPCLRVTVLDPERIAEGQQKDLLLIGTLKDQPLFSRWADRMPVQPGGKTAPEARASWNWLPWSRAAIERSRFEDIIANGSAPEAMAIGFESPLSPRRSAVALIGAEGADQDSVMTLLRGSGRISTVFGSVALLQSGRTYSFLLNPDAYILGHLSWRDAFNDWMADRFWLIPILAVVCVWPLAAWCRQWIERRAAVRLQLQGSDS